MGKISKIIQEQRWWLTTVPLETKKLIWGLREEMGISSIVRFGKKHQTEYEDFPYDRKTIRKVCRELDQIASDDLIYLPLHIMRYVLARRSDLRSSIGLQQEELEMLRGISDEEWSNAHTSLVLDLMDSRHEPIHDNPAWRLREILSRAVRWQKEVCEHLEKLKGEPKRACSAPGADDI